MRTAAGHTFLANFDMVNGQEEKTAFDVKEIEDNTQSGGSKAAGSFSAPTAAIQELSSLWRSHCHAMA